MKRICLIILVLIMLITCSSCYQYDYTLIKICRGPTVYDNVEVKLENYIVASESTLYEMVNTKQGVDVIIHCVSK